MRSEVTTFLFTDIEGSSRLWERSPATMPGALARHDAIARSAVERSRGVLVKMSGDGMHAVFGDPLDAVNAALAFLQALDEAGRQSPPALRARCGMHVGVVERRDNDYFGTAVNRAARIMSAAHGGQVLLSQAVVDLVHERLAKDVALRDLGIVRLRDFESPEHLWQLVHPSLPSAFPPLRSLASTPNNLPLQLTSFVGRARELRELASTLGATRLLTLHGPGGIGKTRVSLQVAAGAIDDFPDGVWFVELAGLSDGTLVAQAVASTLGVKEQGGAPVLEALLAHVRDRSVLIVVDNCEHLVEACADLVDRLLRAGPRVKVLATSRERLHIAGETLYEVPPLTVPDPRQPLGSAELARYEAVRMFCERASAAQPMFTIREDNAAAVAAICQRLDGIPLALELAAARMRSLSAHQILERLNDRFQLLTTGHRTALPRQQTLRALIDWSHDLLPPAERTLFARLAVFTGGWRLESAEAVTSGEPIAAHDVVDLLGNLVEKSLVTFTADTERYRLLETVKQYAQERLDCSVEAGQVRTEHLQHFVALAETARSRLNGPEQRAWLERLDVERENLLAAHAFADRATGGVELGLRLASAMRRYWINRGLPQVGYRMTIHALARPGADHRDLRRCDGLFDAGQLCSVMGRYREARTHLEESIAIAREIDNRPLIAVALQPLGIAYHGEGDIATARCVFEEALVMARELANPGEIAAALTVLAQLDLSEGRLDAAQPRHEEALALVRKLDDREAISICLLNLALVCIGRGTSDRARPMLLEALDIARDVGSKRTVQSVFDVASGLAALRGEWKQAARLYGAAEELGARTGVSREPGDEAVLRPLIERARESLGAERFAAEEASTRGSADEGPVQDLRAWLLQP